MIVFGSMRMNSVRIKTDSVRRKRAVVIIAVLSLLIWCKDSRGQNINYSQYRNAPFFVNPSLVGTKSEVALSVMHRSQTLTEVQKYNTSSLMIVSPLMNAKKTRRWGGWGLSVLNDELKGDFDFRTQGIAGAYAYNLLVSSKAFISFGMQAGYFQRKISLEGLTTSNQWVDNVGLVPSLGTGETMTDGRKNYMSISSGAVFYVEDDNHRPVASVGIGAFNVNKPDLAMSDGADVLPVKITAHGNASLMSSDKMLIQGEMLYYHENNKSTFYPGARLSYYFSNKNPFDPLQDGSLDIKAGYRVNNAITTELQFHQPGFTIGFSYDFGVASKGSYRSPNDVIEFLFSLRKVIGGMRKSKPKRPETYTTIGKVRDFYSGKSPTATRDGDQSETTPDTAATKKPLAAQSSFKLKHDFKFGFNDAALNAESKAYLDDMVALMNGNKNIRLEIIGHTDNIGTPAANRKMSFERAQVVIDYLIQKGIAPEKLTATPMGAKEPLVPNDNEANRALNRRVEFVIYN